MPPSVVPKASPKTLPELAAYLAPFAPHFRRSTSRESVARYLTGLLTDLPRKHCDTTAAAVAGTSTERLQHLLTDATWEPQALDQQRVQTLVAQSPPHGLLVLDDTGLPKQGRGSVGVARQYSGTLGKVANCQVVVSAHYVADEPTSSAPIHWPLTAQLYLPEAWATVHVPTEVAFQTKPEVALALIDQARAWGVSFAWVVADAGYGDNPTFLQGLEDRQLAYMVGVSSSFGVRLPDEVQAAALVPPPRGRGASPRSRARRPCIRRRRYCRRCQRTTGRPSPGARQTATGSASSSWPYGCTGPRTARSCRPAITASTPTQRAGCSASARCRVTAARSSGITVTCLRTRRCTGWSPWPTAAGPLNKALVGFQGRERNHGVQPDLCVLPPPVRPSFLRDFYMGWVLQAPTCAEDPETQ
jgi:SRSO17 transposase